MNKKKTREVHFGKKALSNVKHYIPEVTNVVDADKPILIEVTPQDVAMAKVRDHRGCAMAVACVRTHKADAAVIAKTVAYLVYGERAYRYRVPESVTREIISFDRRAGFEPGQYQFKAPSTYEQLGSQYHHTGTRGSHTEPRKPPRFRHVTVNVREIMGYSESLGPIREPKPAAKVQAYLGPAAKRAAKEKRTKRK